MTDALQGFPQLSAPIAQPMTGLINQVWLQLLRALWIRTGAQQGGSTLFTGFMTTYPGPVIPQGWIECNGDAISRVDFSVLFGVIGTTWGAGDGSSTFNVPDFRNRTFLGASTLRPLGTYGGSSTVALTSANNGPHAHVITDPGHDHPITDPGHHHTAPAPASNVSTGAVAGGVTNSVTGNSTTGITVNSNTTGITVNSSGSGTPFSIIPPFGAVRIIVKT